MAKRIPPRPSRAEVTGFSHAPGSTVVVVNGTVGADVNKAQMEQRIVNPDLTGTAVGRRDVRAPARPGGGQVRQRGWFDRRDGVAHAAAFTAVVDLGREGDVPRRGVTPGLAPER